MVEVKEFTKDLGTAVEKMRENGAFLTVKCGDEINTMTIGWAELGFQWGRSVMTVLVRNTRHTFHIIEKADSFTVTIPLDNSMKKEIDFCGNKSGRDYDKFKECGLETVPAKTVDTPVISSKNVLTYECRIIYRNALNVERLDKEVDEKIYPLKDYHSFYVGEVEAVYKL